MCMKARVLWPGPWSEFSSLLVWVQFYDEAIIKIHKDYIKIHDEAITKIHNDVQICGN